MAVSPESSIPDGFAAYINTGIERRATIKKFRRHVRIARKSLQKISSTARAREARYSGLCVDRPKSAIDNGVTLIFSGQTNM
jgi:hypothetical protein